MMKVINSDLKFTDQIAEFFVMLNPLINQRKIDKDLLPRAALSAEMIACENKFFWCQDTLLEELAFLERSLHVSCDACSCFVNTVFGLFETLHFYLLYKNQMIIS